MMRTKVLLADRSATIQRIVSMALEGEPLDVIVASSGEEALEKLRSERPDILLVDMRLPDMNGIELCKTLRNDPAWEEFAGLPVVLMMGIYDTMQSEQQESIQEQARAAGASDILVKPFDPKELIQKIHTLVPPTTGEPLEVATPGSVVAPGPETAPEPGPAPQEPVAPMPMAPFEGEETPGAPAESGTGVPETIEEPTVTLSEEERMRLLSEAGVPPEAGTVPTPVATREELSSEIFEESEASAEAPPEPAAVAEEPIPEFAWEEEIPESRSGDTETVIMPSPESLQVPPGPESGEKVAAPEEAPSAQPETGEEVPSAEPLFAAPEETSQESAETTVEDIFKVEDTTEESLSDVTPFDVWATDTAPPEGEPAATVEEAPAPTADIGKPAASAAPGVIRQKTLELDSEEPAASPVSIDLESVVEALLRNERFIELLAQKIVAHLSKPLLEDIAWQILPDLADRMLRQKVAETAPGPSSQEGE